MDTMKSIVRSTICKQTVDRSHRQWLRCCYIVSYCSSGQADQDRVIRCKTMGHEKIIFTDTCFWSGWGEHSQYIHKLCMSSPE